MGNNIKNFKKFNENISEIVLNDTLNSVDANDPIDVNDINNIMQQSVEYYKYIDIMGPKLAKVITEQIEPLLQEGKYNEAKKVVREFYKPSRYDDHVVFIEYDLIYAHINRRKNSNE